jgi:hypothetical protein
MACASGSAWLTVLLPCDGTAQPILDDERTRAFLAGTVRGFELALAQPKTRAIGDPAGDKLLADAIKTRPAKRAK